MLFMCYNITCQKKRFSTERKIYMNQNTHSKLYQTSLCGLFAAIIAICSWISVPIPPEIPFTMQTFAVFCTLGVLGGGAGTAAILVYILVGAIGIPVYAEFTGGLGILFGYTGGYFAGFIFSGLVYWLITRLFGKKLLVQIIAMAAGMIVCYILGTLWFMLVSANNGSPIGFISACALCVLPYIIPDAAKITLAILVSRRITKYVRFEKQPA